MSEQNVTYCALRKLILLAKLSSYIFDMCDSKSLQIGSQNDISNIVLCLYVFHYEFAELLELLMEAEKSSERCCDINLLAPELLF